LRFTNVFLENWKNFAKIDVDLQRRVFLVGPNASGKSNLWDVFRFLHDIVAVGGGFQNAVQDKRGGVSSLRCLAARRYSDIIVKVSIGNDDNPAFWGYELHFNQDNLRRPIIKAEKVMKDGTLILSRPDSDDRNDPKRLTQTYLEQVYANQPFREVADFFLSVHYLHIVPQLVREPERSVGKTKDPFGGDFLEQVVRNTWHLRGKYEHWRPRGAWQTEEQFSDGTLRLMGLLWASLEGTGPLLLEEPELSLHPEVIRFIPQMFARIQRRVGRQILISTHSPDLLQDEGIGLDEVLLLQPGSEGTSVYPASHFQQIRELLTGGLTLAEAVMPATRPQNVRQLAFFGD